MKRWLLLLLVLLVGASVVEAAWKFNPYTKKRDYYEASGTVDNAANITGGTLPAARIGDNSIMNVKIASDAAIDGSKLANASVTVSKIAYLVPNTTYFGSEAYATGGAGVNNSAFGYASLYANTTGAYNNAFGYGTLSSNTEGSHNNAFGVYALDNNLTGNYNTGFGGYALYSGRTGDNNTALGWNAGRNNTSGSGNVFLGFNAGSNETGSNKLYISNSSTATPLIKGDFAAGTVTITGQLQSDDVAITGGTINNTPIGATTPSTGRFTTLTFDEAVSSCVPADNNCGQTATNTGSPTGANLSAGLQWFDNTTQCFMIRNNDNTANITMSCLTKSFPFGIDNVVATDDILMWKVPRAITVTQVDCYASTDNVVGVLSECASDNVTSCTAVDSADWTVTNAVTGFTVNSGFENPGIAAGAWLKWVTTSVGTTNSNKLSCTVRYTE
jgi:hypothetical protein